MPAQLSCRDLPKLIDEESRILRVDGGGSLVLLHDMSFVERRSAETKQYLFYFFAGPAFLVSLITVVVAQLSWRGWMQGMRALMRYEARALFRKLLDCRNRHGLLAELINVHTGEQWGNFVQTCSMVGLINSAIRLSIRWDQAF